MLGYNFREWEIQFKIENTDCYDSKLGLDCNLDKDLGKKEKYAQLVKYKNTESYLQLYISNNYKERKRYSWRKQWGDFYYYIRY